MRTKAELRGYQQKLATELYESPGRLVVVPMGGGKTIAALTAIQELLADGEIRHGLVLAPRRVVNLVWPDEIREWAHTAALPYQLLNGSSLQRLRQLALIETPLTHLSICGIDNTQWLVESIKGFPDHHPVFDLLVIDEVSRYRNPKSKQARALKSVIHKFRNIWAMTGTPRPNGLGDLYNPLSIVSKGAIWGDSFYKWRKLNFFRADWQGYDWQPFPHRIDVLQAEVLPWATTIDDSDMPELPELVVVPHFVELPPDARRAYATMERDLFARIRREAIQAGAGNQDLATILAGSRGVATGKLAQIANGFIYETIGNPADPEKPLRAAHHLHSAKLDWLSEMVDNLQGAPALVVYEFQEDLAVLRKLLGDGLPTIGGGTSDDQAKINIDAWNQGKLPCLALHAASGGHGLNLQFGGSQILWFGLTWSAELWQQTIKRIHRSGQVARCFVHVCLARGTIDMVKRERVLNKLDAAEAFRIYLQDASRAAA